MSTTLSHRGLPAGVGRFDLLRMFEQVARPGFGLSSTAVALVRHYVLKTMDGDYLPGRICAVWSQACRFAEALGLTPRSINSAERELEQAGFIIRNAGINGERAGDRPRRQDTQRQGQHEDAGPERRRFVAVAVQRQPDALKPDDQHELQPAAPYRTKEAR